MVITGAILSLITNVDNDIKTAKIKDGQQALKIQGDLELISSIRAISSTANIESHIDTKNIRNTREKERKLSHRTLRTGGDNNE